MAASPPIGKASTAVASNCTKVVLPPEPGDSDCPLALAAPIAAGNTSKFGGEPPPPPEAKEEKPKEKHRASANAAGWCRKKNKTEGMGIPQIAEDGHRAHGKVSGFHIWLARPTPPVTRRPRGTKLYPDGFAGVSSLGIQMATSIVQPVNRGNDSGGNIVVYLPAVAAALALPRSAKPAGCFPPKEDPRREI